MKYNTIFENKRWECFEPLDFKAAQELARNALWCTTRIEYFRLLKGRGRNFYIHNKINPNIAYGLHVKKNGEFELLNKNGYRFFPLKEKLPIGIPIPDKVNLPLYILRKLLSKNLVY